MNRRHFLQTSLAATTAGSLASRAEGADFPGIIDSNVSLFRWPFRRLPLDETDQLIAKLRSLGVTKALAGSFESVFHRDLGSANARLAGECARFPELDPIGTVNPTQQGWERDLDRCVTEFRMPGIRLFPSQQGIALDHTLFARLLTRAAEAGLLIQIAVTLEDGRTQPDSIVAPDIDLAPLIETMRKVPQARVQLLNLRPRAGQLASLAAIPNLFLDTARADGTDGVAALIEAVGNERVLFGTHAPFLIPEASLIRVHESALAPSPLRAVLRDNAVSLLS